jgi:tetratricopeptide (TPR) repeat protein
MSRRNDAAKHNNDGNIAYKKKKYADSIECYTNALQLQPDFSIVYSNRAQALYQQRRYTLAVDDNLTASKLDPNFWLGHIRAGKCFVQLGRLDEAWECFHDTRQRFQAQPDAIQIAEFEITRLKWLREQVAEIESLYADGSWAMCEALILDMEEYISQSFNLKVMLCESQYRRLKYMHVLKSVEKVREFLQLNDKQKQSILNMELKSYAAMIMHQTKGKDATLVTAHTSRNLYEVLEITDLASDDDIAQAYTRLAMRYHPGHQTENMTNVQRADARQHFLEVTEAFVVLGDPMMRTLYDTGYTVAEIMSDEVSPESVFCGVPKPHEERSTAQRVLFWCAAPFVAVLGCPVATVWCVKRRLEKPEDEDFIQQEKLRLVHMKRQSMLRNCTSKNK